MFKFFEDEEGKGIEVLAKDLISLYHEAAVAVFSLLNCTGSNNKEYSISCSADSDEELLAEWINTLMDEAEMRSICFTTFKIISLGNGILEAKVSGVDSKISKLLVSREVLDIGKKNNKFIARFIVTGV